MPGSYQRRAFLLLAVFALEPAASSAARAEGDSLWDLLSRTDHTSLETQKNASFTPGGAQSPRRAIGPVPGFTLPASQDGASENDQIFNRPKRKKSGMFGGVGDWWSRLEHRTGTRVTASGHQTLSFRYDSISGSDSAYRDSQYYGQGTNGIYNDTALDVDATFFNALHYHTQISNSPYRNANDNRVKLDYNTKKVRVEWGDFNPTIAGNSLIDFNRSLHGIQLSNHWTPQLKSTLLFSQTRAETRTIVVNGNGSTGPYYVYAGQIVDGSVHVRVDSKDMVQGADRDYTLDPYTGQLNFTHGNVILPSSTIAVSFEALDYSSSKGTIYGARTEFLPNRSAVFGLTYLTQTSPANGTPQQRTERYHGFNQPSFYSTDAPMDLSKPIILSVDGRQLAPNEYTIDKTTLYTNRVYITLSVPLDSLVQIQYYPYNSNATPGDRNIIGLDGRFSLGKLGTITMESAFSGLTLTGKSYSGQALQFQAALQPFKNLHTRLTLKNVSPSFSSVQSPGFNRNEKSLGLDADYQASKKLGFTLNWQKAKRPSYSSSSTSLTSVGNDDYGQYSIGANYRLSDATTFTLSRTNQTTAYILGGNSDNTNDNLSLNYTKGQLSVQGSVAQTVSNVSSSYALLGVTITPGQNTGSLLHSDSSTFTKRVSTQWQPLRWLTLGGSYSDNAIRSTNSGTSTSTNANDTAFDADFRLIRNVHLHYNYDLSDTGNSGLLNTTTPTTTGTTTTTAGGTTTTTGGTLVNPGRFAFLTSQGFPGTRDVIGGTGSALNGVVSTGAFGTLGGGGANNNLGGYGNYSGGYGTNLINTYGTTSFGGRSSTHRINLDYNPRPGMQFGMHVNRSSSLGDYQYNSKTNGIGANFNWDISRRIHLNTVYEVQKLAYTNSLGGSNTNTSVVSLNGRPFGGKLEMELSWQSSKTQSAFNTASTGLTTTPTLGGLTDTSTNLSSLRLGLSYRISSRQSLFTEMTNSISSGYYANKESYLSFGMDYDLTQTLAFRFGWQFRDRAYSNVGSSSTTLSSNGLNYRANSLLAEFNLHF